MVFPLTFPFDPPKVKFETFIYHPLISRNGLICLSYLRKGEWCPSLSVWHIIFDLTRMINLSIDETMFLNWSWEAPTREFIDERELFEEKARHYTLEYAMKNDD